MVVVVDVDLLEYGLGSPQAQRIAIGGLADLSAKVALAEEVLNGIGDVQSLPPPMRRDRPAGE